MLIAHLSDLHMRPDQTLLGRLSPRPFIQAAIDAANAWRPDAVLVTGDLTDTGSAEAYAALADILHRLEAPCYLMAGNHDARGPMTHAFADHAYLAQEGPQNWIVDLGAVRMIGLDSVVADQAHGMLATETLDWVETELAATEQPTILALHHPPFPTGLPGLDEIGCLNGDALAEIVVRHPQVERVLAGHYHRTLQLRWAGTLGQIAPSVVHQTDLASALRGDAAWVLEPPSILLHHWQEHTRLITHTALIGDFGPAHAFGPDD